MDINLKKQLIMESTISQQIEGDIILIDDSDLVAISQDSQEIYLEKRNIKLLMAQLILLDNGK